MPINNINEKSVKEQADELYRKMCEELNEKNVYQPSHYETGKFECIDVMLETQGVESVKNFCICNAFKYLYRHKNKNGVEDIKKAQWYINKFLKLNKKDEVE